MDLIQKGGLRISIKAGVCAVYLLRFRGEVVYAGQSINIFGRLADQYRAMSRKKRGLTAHFASGIIADNPIFDEVEIIQCTERDLDKLELEMIQLHLPKYNVLLNRPVNPIEQNIRELPCIKSLFKKADERAAGSQIKRRRLPPQVARAEHEFRENRDRRMKITLPKLKCLEDEHPE